MDLFGIGDYSLIDHYTRQFYTEKFMEILRSTMGTPISRNYSQVFLQLFAVFCRVVLGF